MPPRVYIRMYKNTVLNALRQGQTLRCQQLSVADLHLQSSSIVLICPVVPGLLPIADVNLLAL